MGFLEKKGLYIVILGFLVFNMSKVMVLGCGLMGPTVAKDCVERDEIDEVLAREEEVEALPAIEEGEKRRPPMPFLSLSERLGAFGEVELGFGPELAIEESKRCLRCDLEER